MTQVGQTELANAFRSGAVLDCTDGGAGRGGLDAEAIRRFCLQQRDEVDPRGIRISNAVVSGTLDLAGVEVPFPLRFSACEFDAAPVLHGARLQELAFTECPRLPGLLANGLFVQRDIDLSRTQVSGAHRTSASTSKRAAIWMCESEIGGRLLCLGTTIRPEGERAIQADRMRVGGTVRLLHDFQAYGEVRLIGAQIGGSVDLSGVRIESATDWALDLGDAVVGGAVFLVDDAAGRRPDIRGRINMRHARVSGQVYVRNATLTRPDRDPVGGGYEQPLHVGTVLSAARLSVGASFTVDGATRINGGIDMSSSDLNGLSLGRGCELAAPGQTALDLTNAELRSSLRLAEGVTVQGTVLLAGTRIRGGLYLERITLSEPEGKSLLKADGITIDGDVEMRGMRAIGGQLKFWRATLNGGLDASEATLVHPEGSTLRLHQATVKGTVRLVDGFSSSGHVLLNRSVIEGRLDLSRGTFVCPAPSVLNPGGHAIQAISATIRGGMDLGWDTVTPSLDLTDATTTVLQDDPARWPERFFVSGFSYDRFDVPANAMPADIWDWRQRRAWLGQQSVYDAGPYEQAARVFRQHGYSYGAEQILIAQRTQARRATTGRRSWLRNALDAVYGWSVGYGYRPSRVLWLLALLLVLVSATLLTPLAQNTLRATDSRGDVYATTGLLRGVEATSQPDTDACGNGQVRCFHPILYAIDTVIPLISLDQRSTWYASPHAPAGLLVEWWLNLATIAGWLLSSIFLLSFARMARTV